MDFKLDDAIVGREGMIMILGNLLLTNVDSN